MALFMVTEEDIETGIFLSDPEFYDTKRDAKEAKLPLPQKGYCRMLYECRDIETLAETQ